MRLELSWAETSSARSEHDSARILLNMATERTSSGSCQLLHPWLYLSKRKSSVMNYACRITIPLQHCNHITTEAKVICIVTKGMHITMATSNHRKRDVTSHTNQALKEPRKPLTMATGVVTYSQNNTMCYSTSFAKAGSNFQFRGIYIRNNLIRIQWNLGSRT
jgi:hypothetical protein